MELCLLLETSLAGVAIELVDLTKSDSEGSLWSALFPQPGQSTAKLLDMTSQGLVHIQKTPKDVSKILVSHGPGSFTGIKIGLAWVYGWKAAFPQVQLGEISGLEAAFLKWERDYSSQSSLALLLPSTRTHGFICSREQGALEIRLIDLTQEGALPFRDSPESWQVLCCGPWAMLQEACTQWGVFLKECEISEVLGAALKGMRQQAKTVSWQQDQLPMPRFMRQPTVVENMEKVRT